MDLRAPVPYHSQLLVFQEGWDVISALQLHSYIVVGAPLTCKWYPDWANYSHSPPDILDLTLMADNIL